MTRQLVVGAEKEAKRSSRPVDAVVMEALVEHLGWRAVDETRAVNTDLSVTEAEEFALSEVASATSAVLRFSRCSASAEAGTLILSGERG